MNDAEVKKQIRQMVSFIKQEAQEKAQEIMVKAEEEFNIEKLQLVEAEKAKIRLEYERKEKQVEVQKRIAYSTELNVSRLKILRFKDDVLHTLFEDAMEALRDVTKDQVAYKKLLKDMILQGVIKLQEPEVSVRCRKEDETLVEGILNATSEEYRSRTGLQVALSVDKRTNLPPGPKQGYEGPVCHGGVTLVAYDGKITCVNTLDHRLELAHEMLLPRIREILFGENPNRKFHD
eukprot:TRINITY_DN995_c1_g1_i3.p1 TRINITY_DN995_c1_g1~~TRINITY_DN995_c1_g1_i3.p1  ORF type:complete len:234 (-),score=69.82 TRINITY_DN995_c1_g1_i3:56-757(-)